MPVLKMKDKQTMVAIAGDITWYENGAVLKSGFMDGECCFFLHDPLSGGIVFAEDERFETGLARYVSLLGTVAYRFHADGAPLPVPLHRFDAADPENRLFMKFMVHEVTVGGARACFRKPD